jgi:uncharacterized membrane protein
MTKKLRAYLITGLVVWLPIFITVLVITSIIEWLDKVVALLPDAYQPNALFGFSIPGLGVIISLTLFVVTGILVTNFVGQRLMEWGEALLQKIPGVRVIYHTTKQIIQALLKTNGQSFRQVVMIEYPRKECWTMAFVTGRVKCPETLFSNQELLTVYVPTTPNPTSGFFLMVPESDAVLLDISVENALKVILSLGAMRQPLFKNI